MSKPIQILKPSLNNLKNINRVDNKVINKKGLNFDYGVRDAR